MQLISANSIGHSINEKKLFHDLSFSIFSGNSLHIKGGNGCGKSTLVRIILGITTPSKGSIEYHNQDAVISYLGHKNAIKNYLTPIENLELLFNNSQLSVALRWLDTLGMSKVVDELSANLSFGQQKKLALIRVLAQPSDLIILDEPFVGLDNATRDLLSNFLKEKVSDGASLILTSHIEPLIDCEVLELGGYDA